MLLMPLCCAVRPDLQWSVAKDGVDRFAQIQFDSKLRAIISRQMSVCRVFICSIATIFLLIILRKIIKFKSNV